MRNVIAGSSSLILAVALVTGCCNCANKPVKPEAGTAAVVTAATPIVMQSGGTDVLKLTAPANTKVAAQDGELSLATPQGNMEVWLVKDATSVAAALVSVNATIAGEFKDFKATDTGDITLTGAPAKHLVGTGHEADDGDDGKADVIVFAVGDHAFVACTHDEHLSPEAQATLMSLVHTAQKP